MKTLLTLIALVLAPYAMGAQDSKNSPSVSSAQKGKSCISAKPVEKKGHEISVHCGPTAAPQPVAEPKLSMSVDSIISLLISIPVGLISGLYTGLIVTRYARFAELRNETIRIIRSINFVPTDSGIAISNDQDVSKLVLISSDLFFLKHRKAGEQVNKLSEDISSANYDARAGRISIVEYDHHFSKWQKIARDLPPSKLVIWHLWGKL